MAVLRADHNSQSGPLIPFSTEQITPLPLIKGPAVDITQSSFLATDQLSNVITVTCTCELRFPFDEFSQVWNTYQEQPMS